MGEGRRSPRPLLRGGNAPISLPTQGQAFRGLHSSSEQYHRLPSPLASPRASAPLGARGTLRYPVPHIASAWQYSTDSVWSQSLPCTGPNYFAPRLSQPLPFPRALVLHRDWEPQCRPPAHQAARLRATTSRSLWRPQNGREGRTSYLADLPLPSSSPTYAVAPPLVLSLVRLPT